MSQLAAPSPPQPLYPNGSDKSPPSKEEVEKAYQSSRELLIELLKAHDGVVSSRYLYRELSKRGIALADEIVPRLRAESQTSAAKWRHHGRSFLTLESFERLRAEQEAVGDDTEEEPARQESPQQENSTSSTSGRSRDQEEQRMCSNYVKPVLEDIYDSIHAPDEVETVFDVQSRRPSSEWRNVDLIAVDWRDRVQVELVTVEAKLNFTASAVMQAANYRRFSHRVWLAIRVQLDGEDPHTVLRERDPLLFDYALSLGLGILVCRLTQGRSYEVTPIQWPSRQEPSEFEKVTFMEHYREELEKACAMATKLTIGVAA